MNIKIKVLKEITVIHVHMQLAVRYEEEDIPNDFPLRRNDVWEATVEVDTGKIVDWPNNPRFKVCRFAMKVCDDGTYTLRDERGNEVAKLENEYVPHGLIPGRYGDYVDLQIEDGVIVNWPKKPKLTKFFSQEGGE